MNKKKARVYKMTMKLLRNTLLWLRHVTGEKLTIHSRLHRVCTQRQLSRTQDTPKQKVHKV